MNYLFRRWRNASRLLICLLLVGGFGWVSAARAAVSCTATPKTTPSMQFPFSTLSIVAPAGSGSFGPIASVQVLFACSGITGATRPVNIYANALTPGNFAAGGLLFGTNLTGFSLLVTANPTPTNINGSTVTLGTVNNNGNGNRLLITFTGQFYRNSGNVGFGSVNALPIASFSYQPASSPTTSFTSSNLGLSSGLSIISGSCTVNGIKDFAIALPNISQTALAGPIGTTAGTTPFKLNYTCPTSGTVVEPTLSSTMPDPSVVGLMDNPAGAGYATNVGLQVTDSNGVPVDIKGANQSPFPSNGTLLVIPYYVRYYRSGAGVISAGQVTGRATYTLNYQ